MYEIILIVQAVIIGLLLVNQAYMFNQIRQSEVITEEPEVMNTGVSRRMFQYGMIIVSTKEDAVKDTIV